MFWNFKEINDFFTQNNHSQLLLNGNWGIEKETLRTTPNGKLALTPHPKEFGDKTTHPYITTDFSESQLELITPPFDNIETTFNYLEKIHSKVSNTLDNELLWPFSMPGNLPYEEAIPIAKFNNSTEGAKKEIYRKGLALRYGKKMQMISGIHYNYSFGEQLYDLLYQHFGKSQEQQDFKNKIYFALVRNFLRYNWLLSFLFGSSPVADDSYNQTIMQKLNIAGDCCPNWKLNCYIKNTTTLRMSPLGYMNELQNNKKISYNNLSEYINELKKLLNIKSPHFARFGIFKDNKQIQLNDNLLQLVAEYYSPVRFKQTCKKDESPLDALSKRGIDYLEIRTFDLDPFAPNGIALEQLYFTHVFILFCLFENSPNISTNEEQIIQQNIQNTALNGRDKRLNLNKSTSETINLSDWSKEIFTKLKLIAQLLDNHNNSNKYYNAVEKQLQKINHHELLPSNQIINQMKKNNETFAQLGLRIAKENQKYFKQYIRNR